MVPYFSANPQGYVDDYANPKIENPKIEHSRQGLPLGKMSIVCSLRQYLDNNAMNGPVSI
jgi:hypothetical protein